MVSMSQTEIFFSQEVNKTRLDMKNLKVLHKLKGNSLLLRPNYHGFDEGMVG